MNQLLYTVNSSKYVKGATLQLNHSIIMMNLLTMHNITFPFNNTGSQIWKENGEVASEV
jgi:hypothetical protein